ncbi:prephenate dehydratase [Actinocorallia herbida]|uniref:Prephenate dehydratase n=2 Tax=Actinocorallia herbida TaxID=58109 RepID=A0A3N1CNQ4_9ACTN|nr:prephenate dehydratase [Actinocorallia herbida]
MADPVLAGKRQVPVSTAAGVVEAVRAGVVGFGVLAWENSVAGLVGATLDLLATPPERGASVWIERSVEIPVAFSLWGRGGASFEEISVVASHSHALAQCEGWLRGALPGAALLATHSTVAARGTAAADATGRTAAIGAPGVVVADGLEVLADGVADEAAASTRFVVLSQGAPAGGEDGERTLLACFQPVNRPGSLLPILEPFALAGVDLLHIESRPTRRKLGDYYFLLEVAAGPARLGGVLAALAEARMRVRVLGALPGRLVAA